MISFSFSLYIGDRRTPKVFGTWKLSWVLENIYICTGWKRLLLEIWAQAQICRIRFLPLYLQKYSNYTIIIPLKHFNNKVSPFTKITWKKSIPKRAYKSLKIWCIWVHFFQVGVYLIHSIFNYNIYPLHIPLLRIIPNRDFFLKGWT